MKGILAPEGRKPLQISDINDWMLYCPTLFVVLETNIGHSVERNRYLAPLGPKIKVSFFFFFSHITKMVKHLAY